MKDVCPKCGSDDIDEDVMPTWDVANEIIWRQCRKCKFTACGTYFDVEKAWKNGVSVDEL